MAFVTSYRQQSGGGGGGIEINGWKTDQFSVSTPFAAGTVTLPLTLTPISKDALTLTLNGQTQLNASAFSLVGNVVTLLYEELYSQPDYEIQAQYPY